MARHAHLASRHSLGGRQRAALQRDRLHVVHVARQSRLLRSGHRTTPATPDRLF